MAGRWNGKKVRKQITYELQRLERGETSSDAAEKCKKSAGHRHYIPVKDLAPDRLPVNDPDLFRFIQLRCSLTGLLEMSEGKTTWNGTGFVQRVVRGNEKPCPCSECEKDTDTGKSWASVAVSTALHVIKDPRNARFCKVRLFFDSDDEREERNGERTLQGFEIHSEDEDEDWCVLECITHDTQLIDNLETWLTKHWDLGNSLRDRYESSGEKLVVVVSHPHGGPKRVSHGEVIERWIAKEVRDQQDWCYYSYTATTCSGSSGAPVYILGKWNAGFGYWFGHPHNHNGVVESSSVSSIGAEATWVKPKQTEVTQTSNTIGA